MALPLQARLPRNSALGGSAPGVPSPLGSVREGELQGLRVLDLFCGLYSSK